MTSKKAAAKKDKQAQTKQPAAKSVLEEAYDEFPYESFVYPQTHPARMHAVARLFSIAPPSIEKAKILELGCASGGNIIPIALHYPKSQILGIDLSSEQIIEANKNKAALGLKNIEFRQLDITKLAKTEGPFDYIICHGVYSWVPGPVRDAIFDVCRNNLSKNGLAVISFNVLPGWAAIKSLREMMIYHTKNFKDTKQQVHEAKQLLNFLYENTPTSNESYRKTIDAERKILSNANDSYLFHEHLESENHQFYLHEFVTGASKAGLCYVGDSEISSMYLGNYSEAARKTLGAITDIVRQEQYIDFLSNRRFRHAILAHKEMGPSINRKISADKILDLYVQARFKFVGAEGKETKFASTLNNVATFTTPDPKAADVLKTLAELNRPVKVDEIAAAAKKKGVEPEYTKRFFLKSGFNLALQNFVTLHDETFEFAHEISKKPKANVWALHQIKTSGPNNRTVTNLKRESVTLTPFNKAILAHLDGKKTLDDLVDLITQDMLKGILKMHKNNVQITDEKQIRAELKTQIPAVLEVLARSALLEA